MDGLGSNKGKHFLSQKNKSYCEAVRHEELDKIVCRDRAAKRKYLRQISFGFISSFSNIPPVGLAIKISATYPWYNGAVRYKQYLRAGNDSGKKLF